MEISKRLTNAVKTEFRRALEARFKEAVRSKSVGSFDSEAARWQAREDVLNAVNQILQLNDAVDDGEQSV